MAVPAQSLLDYLRSRNPDVNVVSCKPGPNTKSVKSAWDYPAVIEQWDDFEFHSLITI